MLMVAQPLHVVCAPDLSWSGFAVHGCYLYEPHHWHFRLHLLPISQRGIDISLITNLVSFRFEGSRL